MILGTAAYMAPEQARGKPADKRSDVWAFGCVLYEMLAGRRPFDGEDASETLASVLARDPDWAALPSAVPPAIRALLGRCLMRDRQRRVADMSAAIFVLDEATALRPDDRTFAAPAEAEHRHANRGLVRWRVALLSVGALLVGAAAAGTAIWLIMRSGPAPVERFGMLLSGPSALTINGADRVLAVTPDGRRVVYVGNNQSQLFVRALDQLEPTVIANSNVLRNVFIAPGGDWVGFVDEGAVLKKVAVNGGAPVTLGQMDATPRGATWTLDGTIIFATINAGTGLQRVSAEGGKVTVLTRPDRTRGEGDHLWPEMLPDGRGVLFTITAAGGATATGGVANADASRLAVLDLNSGTYKTLVQGGSHAHYVPTGHLVYTAGGTLRAIAFDLGRRETRGMSVPVVPRVVTTTQGGGDFSLAADGTLVYVDAPGTALIGARVLVWVDRQGRDQPVAAPPRTYAYPRLSPDGTRLAVSIADQEIDIWVWDLMRRTLTRMTFDPSNDNYPVWTPDGKHIIFNSQRVGPQANLFRQAADGTGTVERVTQSPSQHQATDITRDGLQLVLSDRPVDDRGPLPRDLLILSLAGTHEPRPLLRTPFEERNGVLSPDNRWLAFESDSSGRLEIYVRPFPDVNAGQWQISTAGGTRPLWSRNGRELFYFAEDGALMGVPINARGADWNAGAAGKILGPRYVTGGANLGRTYDVSPDGQRFLMIKQVGDDQTAAPPQIIVVKNWTEELQRLVPVN